MASVHFAQELVKRISKLGLLTEFKAFVDAIRNDRQPPRKYKASGEQPRFEPYQQLGLHHHHLHPSSEPLLICQVMDDDVYLVGLSTHADFCQGNEWSWLRENQGALDWRGCERIRAQLDEDGNSPENSRSPEF